MSAANLFWLPRDDDSLADAAAAYAARAWPIFPCAPAILGDDKSGKQPCVEHGLHAASTDAALIASWWKRWPDATIAWALPHDLVALDVDPRHRGDESLRALELEHAPLPFTLRATTGSGGAHWIFKSPPGVELRQLAGFRPGLDTRVGGRGYLCAAPSLHWSGARYRWHSVVEPVTIPAWLLDLVRVREVERKPFVAPPPLDPSTLSRRQRWARAALEGLAAEVASAANGTRNATLNAAAYRAGQLCGGGLLDAGEARSMLRAAGLACGLDAREIDLVLR